MPEFSRVLLVDDDMRVHELVRWALRPPRFEVHAFNDPREALKRVSELQPDLIICDMMMPTMDGQIFLRLVKQAPDLKRIPFLFLTAVRLGSEVQAALNAGAEAYLVKPFPLAKLVETVNQILSNVVARRLAEADQPSPAGVEERVAAESTTAPAAFPTTTFATSPAAGIPPATVDRVPMESMGTTALSDTALGVPERDLDAPAEDDEAVATLDEPGVPPPVFEGRFSTVEHAGVRIQIVTEAESRPNFVITTIISIGGRGLRKIESFWSHPLRRPEDVELVKRQIELQHSRAAADVRLEPLFGPRRAKVWNHRTQGSANDPD